MFDTGREETLRHYLDRLSVDIMSSNYNELRFLVGVPLGNDGLNETGYENIKLYTYSDSAANVSGRIWQEMIEHSVTPYILVGRRLDAFHGEWANLERSIRLMGDTGIGAVAGAIRNSSG